MVTGTSTTNDTDILNHHVKGKTLKTSLAKKDGDEKDTSFHCGVRGTIREAIGSTSTRKIKRSIVDASCIYMINTNLSYKYIGY